MRSPQCSCGFTELPDESVTDHLLRVFEPADMRGNDGQVHEETDGHACSCGFAASTAGELDGHFLAAFTPPGAIATDGQRHEAPQQHYFEIPGDRLALPASRRE
jgi:hypothetical protein